jgi:hypothetical protein
VVASLDQENRLAFLPLADEAAVRLLAAVPEDRRSQCWWLVLPDGSPLAGDKGGGLQLLLELSSTRPLGQICRMLRLSSAIDSGDRLLARHRKALGRFVPDGPALRRYP